MLNLKCTLLRLCDATASQAGSMRGICRKTAKSVLRVVEDRAGVPDEGRPALLYTPLYPTECCIYSSIGNLLKRMMKC